MIEQLEQDFTAVVCLHCGMHTRVPISTSRDDSRGTLPITIPVVSIVRCEGCGKEAPYLACEIFAHTARSYANRPAA